MRHTQRLLQERKNLKEKKKDRRHRKLGLREYTVSAQVLNRVIYFCCLLLRRQTLLDNKSRVANECMA